VDFVGLPTNSCGINVVEQFKTDSVYIQVFEDYGGNKCFLDQIHIEVNDEVIDITDLKQKDYEEFLELMIGLKTPSFVQKSMTSSLISLELGPASLFRFGEKKVGLMMNMILGGGFNGTVVITWDAV